MSKICKKFIIHGLVQGVGFRYFAYKTAEKYSIFGYAKNLYDGTVEVVASGDKDNIEQFKKDLKIGPSRSRITKFEEEEYSPNIDFLGFTVY